MRVSRLRTPLLAALLALVVALLAACDDSTGPVADDDEDLSPAGPKRTFAMGFSALPPENTRSGYEEAFQMAGKYGDIVLLQRPVPWDEFLPGDTEVSKKLRDTTTLERGLAKREGLDIFLAIDPTDPLDRNRLSPLPEALRGKNFGSDDVRRSYLAYVRYMAGAYQPKYMALAVDINWLAGGNPEEFERFLPVYQQAYDLVKDAAPDTQVFVTFQYEDLLGRLPWNKHNAEWDLIKRFGDKLDVFAISSHPSLAGGAIQDLPDDYYLQIRDHTNLPIAIADMGYSSGPGSKSAVAGREGSAGFNSGSEAEQLRFLQRVIGAADQLQMQLVVWFAATDPSYVLEPPLDAYAAVGLRASDGTAKAAWSSWVQHFRRPYGQQAQDARIDVPRRRNPIAVGSPEPIATERARPGDQRDPFRDAPSTTPAPLATTPPDASPTEGARQTPTPIS